MVTFHKFIYHTIIRPSRLKKEARIINNLDGKTVLEVGYFDDFFKKLLVVDKIYFGIDPAPEKMISGTTIVAVENFESHEKFDIVVASNILEHTDNPVLAIEKIKNLSKKYICISVPYEPFYTISRFFVLEKEHFWTIHPNLLEKYFGKPIIEKYMHLKRTYFAVYKK